MQRVPGSNRKHQEIVVFNCCSRFFFARKQYTFRIISDHFALWGRLESCDWSPCHRCHVPICCLQHVNPNLTRKIERKGSWHVPMFPFLFLSFFLFISYSCPFPFLVLSFSFPFPVSFLSLSFSSPFPILSLPFLYSYFSFSLSSLMWILWSRCEASASKNDKRKKKITCEKPIWKGSRVFTRPHVSSRLDRDSCDVLFPECKFLLNYFCGLTCLVKHWNIETFAVIAAWSSRISRISEQFWACKVLQDALVNEKIVKLKDRDWHLPLNLEIRNRHQEGCALSVHWWPASNPGQVWKQGGRWRMHKKS